MGVVTSAHLVPPILEHRLSSCLVPLKLILELVQLLLVVLVGGKQLYYCFAHLIGLIPALHHGFGCRGRFFEAAMKCLVAKGLIFNLFFMFNCYSLHIEGERG